MLVVRRDAVQNLLRHVAGRRRPPERLQPRVLPGDDFADPFRPSLTDKVYLGLNYSLKKFYVALECR
jgi:hypothetical protein